MKTIVRYTFLAVVAATFCFTNNAKAQAFQQGKVIISGGYGFGNFTKSLFNTFSSGMGNTDFKMKSFGPVFGKFEYAVSDKVGIGVNIAHIGINATYNTDGGKYQYTVNWNNTSALARINLHFAKSEKFDAYWGAGLGYRFGKWKFEDNDPDSDVQVAPSVNPFGFETTIGARYYFIPNLGVSAEAGIAKAPIQFGLSAAF